MANVVDCFEDLRGSTGSQMTSTISYSPRSLVHRWILDCRSLFHPTMGKGCGIVGNLDASAHCYFYAFTRASTSFWTQAPFLRHFSELRRGACPSSTARDCRWEG
ncbi:unnamed protein product [Linum trigynum]|uniref:Uncharacterized protein n=1 Tax=Linum trigynum TaxID=586398 RepID=A0AAV2E0A7_9ROSI